MKESKFNTEIVKSLKAAGAWAYKIPDQAASWTWARTRFTAEKPCDTLACYGGRFIAIESKQMKKWKSFGMRDMRPSQIRNLDEIMKAGGKAYVFLNVRMARPRENRLIIFEWAAFRHWAEILAFSGKELAKAPHIRGRKDLFALKDWLEGLSKDYG